MSRVAWLALIVGGCAPATAVEVNRGSVLDADGSYSFYAGKGIGQILAQGKQPGSDHPTPFTRLKVSPSFVEAAQASPNRVKTISFEVPDPSIEATVHKFVAGTTAMETLTFHPGDPWVSGVAQVAVDDEGFTMGVFKIVKWTGHIPSMSTVLAQQIYMTGFVADESMPAVKYADSPPEADLPAGWE